MSNETRLEAERAALSELENAAKDLEKAAASMRKALATIQKIKRDARRVTKETRRPAAHQADAPEFKPIVVTCQNYPAQPRPDPFAVDGIPLWV